MPDGQEFSFQSFNVLYPERREVSAHTIGVWYHDAVENGDITDGETDPHKQAMALHRAGIITLVR